MCTKRNSTSGQYIGGGTGSREGLASTNGRSAGAKTTSKQKNDGGLSVRPHVRHACKRCHPNKKLTLSEDWLERVLERSLDFALTLSDARRQAVSTMSLTRSCISRVRIVCSISRRCANNWDREEKGHGGRGGASGALNSVARNSSKPTVSLSTKTTRFSESQRNYCNNGR